jgi:hypothetical protein
MYHLTLSIFKLKLTHLIAPILALFSLFIFRRFYFPTQFTYLMVALTISMGLSGLNSIHPTACIGYFLWMIFSFLIYFLIPYTLFHYMRASTLLQIYFNSFFCLGLYALLQFLFSFIGIYLPGVTQYIFSLARGQAFTYEPSFYALYMTPFTFFYTTKFLLQPPNKRKLHLLIWPNLLFLISTSTGCFFSYILYFLQMVILKYLKILQLNLLKLFSQITFLLISLFSLIWLINKKLIIAGFLKFFFSGTSHFSIQCRWQGIVDYWNIFLENPLLGVGLGAGPFYQAQNKLNSSPDLFDPTIVATYSPTNTLTEILASLGLLGSFLFTIFLFLLFRTFYRAYQIPSLSSEEKISLIAFILSIGVMLATLQFNQTITRPYLWVHIGIFVGYANSLIRSGKQLGQ